MQVEFNKSYRFSRSLCDRFCTALAVSTFSIDSSAISTFIIGSYSAAVRNTLDENIVSCKRWYSREKAHDPVLSILRGFSLTII